MENDFRDDLRISESAGYHFNWYIFYKVSSLLNLPQNNLPWKMTLGMTFENLRISETAGYHFSS